MEFGVRVPRLGIMERDEDEKEVSVNAAEREKEAREAFESWAHALHAEEIARNSQYIVPGVAYSWGQAKEKAAAKLVGLVK